MSAYFTSVTDDGKYRLTMGSRAGRSAASRRATTRLANRLAKLGVDAGHHDTPPADALHVAEYGTPAAAEAHLLVCAERDLDPVDWAELLASRQDSAAPT